MVAIIADHAGAPKAGKVRVTRLRRSAPPGTGR